jgi:hypothetical protein
MESKKKLIGRAEVLSFPELGFEGVHARIDTGAKTSALWVSSAVVRDGKLHVVFFGESSPHFTGTTHIFDEFERSAVANSTGHIQKRFKIVLLVKLKGKKVRAWFTLADRSTQVYPVLIGRNVLTGKFVVDVKKGHSLKEAEQQRSESLGALLKEHSDEEEV